METLEKAKAKAEKRGIKLPKPTYLEIGFLEYIARKGGELVLTTNIQDYWGEIYKELINSLVKKGYLQLDDGGVKITFAGADYVIARYSRRYLTKLTKESKMSYNPSDRIALLKSKGIEEIEEAKPLRVHMPPKGA